MRATLWFFCRFGAAPIVLWLVAGPALFRLWLVVDMLVEIYGWVATSEKLGARQGVSAAAKAERTKTELGTPDHIAASISQLVAHLGWRVVPQVAVVESVPGYENAAVTRRLDVRPLILMSSRLVASAPPEVIRAVLAHELGHLLRLNRFCQMLAGLLRFWTLVIGFAAAWMLGDLAWAPIAWGAGRAALYLLELAIRRSCETRADRLAVAVGCGGDQARFLKWILATRKNRRMAPEWLSTHPSFETRIRRLSSQSTPPTPGLAPDAES